MSPSNLIKHYSFFAWPACLFPTGLRKKPYTAPSRQRSPIEATTDLVTSERCDEQMRHINRSLIQAPTSFELKRLAEGKIVRRYGSLISRDVHPHIQAQFCHKQRAARS